MTVIVFDSGIGGLSVLREARIALPEHRFVYIGDDAGFPYGDWAEQSLVEHILELFDGIVSRYQPDLAIIACNTASTLIMPALRDRFAIPFVGTVPAIKPAAERTRSGLITVLGTPGTVKRRYTQKLVEDFASSVSVNLVGSAGLARMAERYMQRLPIDVDSLANEIQPCFLESGDKKTDIIVLACTHYPFLTNEMRKLAPWPVDWLNPAEAIAQRAVSLLGVPARHDRIGNDLATMTSNQPGSAVQRLLQGFGLTLVPFNR